ncbi:MAG: CheB methylesterase domain-containing protein, partial [Planctomycetota bacterium]
QHMPPVFTATLAKSLGKDVRRPAHEAEDGMPIRDGEIYVAPGGKHLEVVAHGREVEARLTVAPPEHFCRPSVNPLFRTAARIYGPALVGLMLTGMGDDGIEATADLVDAGGLMLAQDEQSSVVWGMPGAVVKAGLAHRTIPLDLISGALSRVCAAEAVSL